MHNNLKQIMETTMKYKLFMLLFFVLGSKLLIGQSLVINEIFADPATDLSGDANGDGTRDAYDDEFVEIINNGITEVDISGFTISDASSIRHTFPSGTIIYPNESIVVFGGGVPTGISGTVQTASTGSLLLNNSGDIITIMNGSAIIASYTYGTEGGDDQSIGRNPDITGGFEKHSSFAPGGALYSPGKKNTDGTPLPVELTTFTAAVIDQTVELNWETATEVNNYGFEVERSEKSKVKSENWRKIGFINGHGNSNSPKYYSYKDIETNFSGKYLYRLKQIDFDGAFEYTDVLEVNLGSPNKFELTQNYPNPFNPVTNIQFNLPEESRVRLSIFNVLGEEVVELLNESISAGFHNVKFDGTKFNSGIYFYKLEADDFMQIKKMMLVK